MCGAECECLYVNASAGGINDRCSAINLFQGQIFRYSTHSSKVKEKSFSSGRRKGKVYDSVALTDEASGAMGIEDNVNQR